tara:strand:+ start:67 stop:537 length:471 start_codon:yes stop_codon:yes gene_type:complete
LSLLNAPDKIGETEGFLTKINFVEQRLESKHLKFKKILNPRSFLDDVCRQLDEYFEGKRQKFDLSLKPHGTKFQCSAWGSLLSIPYGETRTYMQQAESISNPLAIRAIGKANSLNPIPVIIPCHRVISKNGSLTGYSGGLDRKAQLLELEHSFKRE